MWKYGVDHQVAVAGGEAGHLDPVGGHPQRPVVGLDDTLRPAGRPRGEQDVGGIGRGDGTAGIIDLGQPLARDPLVEPLPRLGTGRRRAVGDHDHVEIGEVDSGVAEHRRAVDTEEVGRRDEDANAGPSQDVGRFRTLEPGVDRDEHRPDPEGAERRDDPPGTVRCPDRQPIARGDAGGDEGCSEPAGGGVQFGVGQLDAAFDHGNAIAVTPDGVGEERRDGRQTLPRVHRSTASSTFVNFARLPPMIRRIVSKTGQSSARAGMISSMLW